MERVLDCIYNDVCQQEDCSKNCIRYLEVSYLLEHSNLPKAQQQRHKLYPEECDLEAFKQLAGIQKDIENFVNGNNSLYLYSAGCGNGKTTWAVKLLLQYFNEIWSGNGFRRRGLFINVPTFLSKCKEVMNRSDKEFEEMRSAIPKTDFVIFDDMVVYRMSAYDYTTLLNYADQRIFNARTTMYTGNVPLENLHEFIGDRLASRICSGITIELKGLDQRYGSTSDNQ